jgi:1-deoxy-D-xylulose-5-phosphate synthase
MVRYPRDSVAQPAKVNIETAAEIGKAIQTRTGKQTALLVFGSLFNIAQPIADELDISLVNMRFIKPLDEKLIKDLANSHDYLVTLEDASIAGGAGSAVVEYLSQEKISTPLLRLGLSDEFPSQGSREQILKDYGLDADTIRNSIVEFTRG